MKEHFIIAGFQRCGTTYLANALALHPQIEMAKPLFPEPKYFLNEKLSLEEYSSLHFSEDTKIRGDKSTSYSDELGIAPKIKGLLPKAKVILCLRDPVFRAISNYQFSTKNGFENRALEEVFCENPSPTPQDESKYFRYLERGNYLAIIKEFRIYFGDQLVLLNYEMMARNPLVVLNQVLDFIGIEGMIEPLIGFNQSETRVDQNVIDYLKDYYSNEREELARFVDIDMNDWT